MRIENIVIDIKDQTYESKSVQYLMTASSNVKYIENDSN